MSRAKKPVAAQLSQAEGCPVDPLVAGIALFLLLYGLVMVGSASLEIGAKTYGNAFHLVTRHMVYLGISAVAAIAALSVPISVWQKYDTALLFVAFLLLALVLVPGIGKEVMVQHAGLRWVPSPCRALNS